MKYIKYLEGFFNKKSESKLKLVRQEDDISCGPASLKMISDYYKLSTSIEELKIIMGTDYQSGTTDIKMKKGLDYLSLDYEQFNVGNKEECYTKAKEILNQGGFILFRTLTKGIKHWISCDSFNGKFHILDPWLGIYDLSESDLDKVWQPRQFDGFIVKGIKKFDIGSISIEHIQEQDKEQIIHMCSLIFSNVMSYEENIEYITEEADFTKSVKLVANGNIVGCYLLKDISIKKLTNQKGIEGIALAVLPSYRKYGLGEKLKDWLEKWAKNKGYDFIFGQHLKGLKNIDYWLKRRELFAENEHSYYTIKYLNK